MHVVNGNLLEVAEKVADFLRDITHDYRGRVEPSFDDQVENSGRVEPYHKPDLSKEIQILEEEKDKLDSLVGALREEVTQLQDQRDDLEMGDGGIESELLRAECQDLEKINQRLIELIKDNEMVRIVETMIQTMAEMSQIRQERVEVERRIENPGPQYRAKQRAQDDL